MTPLVASPERMNDESSTSLSSAASGPVAVSAPGKVLLAGGYLVLDRAYTGLVFGLSARIHVHAQADDTVGGVSLSEITVRSPQFLDALWTYGYRMADGGGPGVSVIQLSASSPRNSFVETALTFALSYAYVVAGVEIRPATFTILADNEYYSHQGSNPSSSGDGSVSQFKAFGVTIANAHKTGLGSSAALVTAFTAAALSLYLPRSYFDLMKAESRTVLHNLAQAAHCAAQGKVGSGFDVAAAVYGSCVYRRFSPSVLDQLNPSDDHFGDKLKKIVNDAGEPRIWDTEIGKDSVQIPYGLRFVMCDVDCGTQTVSMVKKVLDWRKSKPEEAKELWDKLQSQNEHLQAVLAKLSELQKKDKAAYGKGMQAVVQGEDSTGSLDSARQYSDLQQAISAIRSSIQRMSTLSGAPIEPPPQTKLIDTCSQVPGIAGGVVPGAGGYDAVVLVVIDHPDVFEKLGKVLTEWNNQPAAVANGDGPVMGRVRILGVREELNGARIERDAAGYAEWIR